MKFRWSPAPPQPLLAKKLAEHLGILPLLAQCLLNRGLSESDPIHAFLAPRLKQLADPFLLPDMATAVERLFQALDRREPLVIFGDYDVDGVTSTALLLEVLGRLGWTAHYYLPNRLDEGYGLSLEAIDNCLKKYPVRLLLAVDCGSTARNPIQCLKQRGVDVIVLDHHQLCTPRPEPVALVNPHAAPQPASNGTPAAAASESPPPPPPFAELCSAGLSFKLAHALVKRGRQTGLPGAAEFDLRPLLDLVALGTIADIVPLTGENRIFVAAGLERLNTTQRPGLMALKEVAQTPSPLGPYEVGYQLGPRLNAAGRLETAEEALRLLLARTTSEAIPIARNLDARNRERQSIERTIVEEVLSSLRARFDPEKDFAIVEGGPLWHVGVVGIVASRVLDAFYRPTIIIGGQGDQRHGSGRSIAGFDLAAALRECGDLLVRHGGHAMAAGLSIATANVEPFRRRLNEIARRKLKPECLKPSLRLDTQVDLDDLTLPNLHHLRQLQPTGQGNPVPHFFACNLAHQRPLQRIGAKKQHVKMWVTNGRSTHEALWWNAGNEALPVGRFDLAFAPLINEFNLQQRVQLRVLDWRATDASSGLELGDGKSW